MAVAIHSLIAAIVVAGIGAASAAAGGLQAEPAIRVVSDVHEVDYPEEVVFKLEAEAACQITEVTLFYHLAGRDIRVYGYPQFAPGRRVSAEFTVRTGGPDYLPAGVGIEYYYRIVDSRGNVLETERSRLEYLDPAYGWRELRHGDLIVLWHDLSPDGVRRVAANVQGRLETAKEMFGLESVRPIKAVVLSSRAESERGFPFVSEAARRGHLYGGFAFGQFNLFLLAGLSEESMSHEATHLLLEQSMVSPLARIPAWLNEGLATYFEPGAQHREPSASQAARDGTFLRLRSMGTVPGRPDEVRVFYSQSWSVVKYMIDTYGPERMTELLGTIDSGVRIDDALRRVYGVGTDELEAEWRTQFVSRVTLAPRPDPGTIGTTLLISGALAIAAAVTGYRWLSRRSGGTESEDGEPLDTSA